jgi:hypothetical protein
LWYPTPCTAIASAECFPLPDLLLCPSCPAAGAGAETLGSPRAISPIAWCNSSTSSEETDSAATAAEEDANRGSVCDGARRCEAAGRRRRRLRWRGWGSGAEEERRAEARRRAGRRRHMGGARVWRRAVRWRWRGGDGEHEIGAVAGVGEEGINRRVAVEGEWRRVAAAAANGRRGVRVGAPVFGSMRGLSLKPSWHLGG